jgi:nitrite reductase/ring-hydroxylating ferredoxin subunit
MRKLILLLILVTFFSCEKNDTIDFLPKATVDVTLNLNLPQYQNLQIPTGWVYIEKGPNKGLQGILIQNTGLTPKYKAFERACPNNDCNTPMIFDGSLRMKCSCDQSEYSIIDGSPQTSGNIHFAREYRVLVLNSTTLNITNF